MKINYINSYNYNCTRKPKNYGNIAFSANKKDNKLPEKQNIFKKITSYFENKDSLSKTIENARKEAKEALSTIDRIKKQRTAEIIRLAHSVFYNKTNAIENKLNTISEKANKDYEELNEELSIIQQNASKKYDEAMELIENKDNLPENYEYDPQTHTINQYSSNSALINRISFSRDFITIEEFGIDKSDAYEFEDGFLTCFEKGIKQNQDGSEDIEKAFYINNNDIEYYENLNNSQEGKLKADKYIKSENKVLTGYQINKISDENNEVSEIALFRNDNSISLYKNMYIKNNEVKKADELIEVNDGKLSQYKEQWAKYDNESIYEIALNYIKFNQNGKPISYKKGYIKNADGTNRANIYMTFMQNGNPKHCSYDYEENQKHIKSSQSDYRFLNGNLYHYENNVTEYQDGTIISNLGVVFDDEKQPVIYYTDYIKKPDESQFAKKSLTFMDGKLHSYQKEVKIDSANNSQSKMEIFFDKQGNVINGKGIK